MLAKYCDLFWASSSTSSEQRITFFFNELLQTFGLISGHRWSPVCARDSESQIYVFLLVVLEALVLAADHLSELLPYCVSFSNVHYFHFTTLHCAFTVTLCCQKSQNTQFLLLRRTAPTMFAPFLHLRNQSSWMTRKSHAN